MEINVQKRKIEHANAETGDRLLITGDVDITGELNVAGSTTHDIDGPVDIAGDLTVTGDATVTGELTVSTNEDGVTLTDIGGETDGQTAQILMKSTTLDLSSSPTAADFIPANAVILASVGRVLTTIAGNSIAAFTLTQELADHQDLGGASAVTAGTMCYGPRDIGGPVEEDDGDPPLLRTPLAEQNLVFVGDQTATSGTIRVTIFYILLTDAA